MSWIEYDADCHFPIQNLPFGVISTPSQPIPRCASAIGPYVIDLKALADAALLTGLPFSAPDVFSQPTLNAFMALPRTAWRATRARLTELLRVGGDGALKALAGNALAGGAVLLAQDGVTMHLPAAIGDYTDFYSSREHATNVGTMFRGLANALQPNWLTLPVGYHGRASSVVPSGTPVVRPRGQLQKDKDDPTQVGGS